MVFIKSRSQSLRRAFGAQLQSYSRDSASIPTSLSRAMSADSSGGFLVGLETGMLAYNAQPDRFTSIKALEGKWITQIIPVDTTTVYLCTRKGLVKYIPVTKAALFYRDQQNDLFKMAKKRAN